MKIAQIAPPWITIPPRNYGGTETVIYHLVEELVAQGHDVTLFAPGDAKTSAKQISFLPQSLTEVSVPWTAHLQPFYHLQKSIDYIKEHAQEFDIIHTHLSSSSDMYIFPLTTSLALPHVTTLHSCFPFERVQTWIGEGDHYYMEWASSAPMVAISETAKEAVPYSLNFVGIVHNGLPVTEFRPTGAQREDFFVWLGRFVPEKGTHLAIQAAKLANVPIVLAGVVYQDQRASVRYFEEEIKPLIDNEQVRYIGPVNMTQKVDLLSRARGFLNPIQWEEPFGMVMIEAMASGCPVITFDRGAAPEILVHGKTGFLVRNIDEMVQFIPRIDEVDRNVTRRHVEENFSVRVMAENYVKIYQKVIETKCGSSMAIPYQVKPSTALTIPNPALVQTVLSV